MKKAKELKRKTSISLGPKMETLLAQYPEDKNSWILERTAECFLAMVREAMPALNSREWLCIMDSFNGTILDPVDLSAQLLPDHVQDSFDLEYLAEKWGLPVTWVDDTLRPLDYSARIAVLDVVRRFWAADHQKNHPERVLRQAGAVILPEPQPAL